MNLVIERKNSGRKLDHVPNVVNVFGKCGSGKSTYFLARLIEYHAVKTVVVQPDAMTAGSNTIRLRDAMQSLGVRGDVSVVSADQFLRGVFSPGLVVVDEVHTMSPTVRAAVMLAGRMCKRVALMTATFEGKAGGARDTVAITSQRCEYVAFNVAKSLQSFDGTMWDPVFWGDFQEGSMVTYPVTSKFASRLSSFYKSRAYSVHVVDKDTRVCPSINQHTVVLVMPGVGDGLTIDTDVLIDTGYTAGVVMRHGVCTYVTRRTTIAEHEQRVSRVGRNRHSLVIEAGVRRGHVDEVYVDTAADVLLCASGARRHKVFDREACLSALSQPWRALEIAAESHMRRGMADGVRLYNVGRLCLPSNTPRMDGGTYAALHGCDPVLPESDLGFADACDIFISSPNVYRYALYLALVEKGMHRGVVADTVITMFSQSGLPDSEANRSYIVNMMGIMSGNGYGFANDPSSVRIRFARAISWLSQFDVVKIPESGLKPLGGPVVTGKDGSYQDFGDGSQNPRGLLNEVPAAARIREFAAPNNLGVVLVAQGEYDGNVMFVDKGNLSKHHAQRRKSSRRVWSMQVLVVHYEEVGWSDTWICDPDGNKYIAIVGYSLVSLMNLQMDARSAKVEYQSRAGGTKYISVTVPKTGIQVVDSINDDAYDGTCVNRAIGQEAVGILRKMHDSRTVPILVTDTGGHQYGNHADVHNVLSTARSGKHTVDMNPYAVVAHISACLDADSNTSRCSFDDHSSRGWPFVIKGYSIVHCSTYNVTPMYMRYVDRGGKSYSHVAARLRHPDELVYVDLNVEGDGDVHMSNEPDTRVERGTGYFGGFTPTETLLLATLTTSCQMSQMSVVPVEQVWSSACVWAMLIGLNHCVSYFRQRPKSVDVNTEGYSWMVRDALGMRIGEAKNPGPNSEPISDISASEARKVVNVTAQARKEATQVTIRTGFKMPPDMRGHRPRTLSVGALSGYELKLLEPIENTYSPNDFWISLCEFLIKTSASEKFDKTAGFIDGSGAVVYWRDVFARMEEALPEGRFKLRAYATGISAKLWKIFQNSEYLQDEFRRNRLKIGERSVDPVEAYFSLEWNRGMAPSHLRRGVAAIARTHSASLDGKFSGDIGGIAGAIENTHGTKPAAPDTTHVNIDA